MSRYFDDELTHSGVKGMKWRKHKYRLVKDANGKLRYVYDNDNTARKQTNGNDAARRMQQETQAKRILADVIKKGGDPNHSYTVGYTDKDGKHISGKYMPNDKSLSAVSFDKKGKVSPVYSKAAKELMADNKRKYEEHNRQGRLRRAEANEKQVERRKRIRQAEANKEQIEKRKKAQRVANNYKAKATGRRIVSKKPYQSKVEFDQDHQSRMLRERDRTIKEHGPEHSRALTGLTRYDGRESASQIYDRDYKDRKRTTQRLLEGFDADGTTLPTAATSPGEGHKARAAESTARHKAAKKAQEKRKKEKAERVANNYKAKATGKRAEWAFDKPYQSRVEYDQENQRDMLKERDKLKKHGGYYQFGRFDISGNKTASQWHDEHYKNQKRWTTREMEGFYANRADIGQRSRAAESTARHKAAVKAQKKKRITDTIDKGRKAVEEFFTPKKKKKR